LMNTLVAKGSTTYEENCLSPCYGRSWLGQGRSSCAARSFVSQLVVC
jgi:hypothetical protein